MIIDTDVLIWYLRGNDKAKEAVINAIPFSISVVTFMELLQGARNRNEMDAIKKEFNEMGVHIIPINARISSAAANLVEEYTLSHSMEMADALIAGTCLENNEELLTANDKHYRMIDNLEIAVFRS